MSNFQETNSVVPEGGSRVLWVYKGEYDFPVGSPFQLVWAEYEDRSSQLRKALIDCKTPLETIQAVFPGFDATKHIVRLGQEEDRSTGYPLRFLQVWEIVGEDAIKDERE